MAKRYCPNCGSENVSEEDGKYICNACDFEADVFPEKHLIVDDIDDDEEEEMPVKKEKKNIKKTKAKTSKKGRKK
jgi:uncharacterized Zn finger protein (UPF0148 family)